jgi:hypothetical protein
MNGAEMTNMIAKIGNAIVAVGGFVVASIELAEFAIGYGFIVRSLEFQKDSDPTLYEGRLYGTSVPSRGSSPIGP